MEDTVSSVFLAGRERHARLRQFGLFVIAGAAAVHLTLFLGYTRTVHDAEVAKQELRALDGADEATTRVELTVSDFTASINPKPILERLLTDIRADFRDLNRWIDDARAGRPSPPPETRGPQDTPNAPNMAEQGPPPAPEESKDPGDVANAPKIGEQNPPNMPRDPMPPQRPRPARDSPLRDRLDGLSDEDTKRLVRPGPEFRTTLDPIIAESIVQARFAETNAAWRRQIDDDAQPAAGAVRDAAAALPKVLARASQIVPTVDKALAEARSVVFTPPPGDRWWQTVNAKMAAIAEIAHDAAEKMVDGRRTSELTADLAKDSAEATKDAEALVADLETKRKELDDQAKNALTSLATFAKPLEFVAVDVSMLVRWFPLVVGMALALAAWFGTEARRGYFEALDFAAHASPDDAGWKRVVDTSRATLRHAASPWLPWLGGAAVWCGAAAWRLTSLDSQTITRAPGAAAAGVALVAAAIAHRTWVEHRRR